MIKNLKISSLSRVTGLVLLLCGLLIVYFATVQSLLARWNQIGSEYGHGPLLVVVIIWLLFRERKSICQAISKPCYWALLPAAFFSVLWSAGHVTQVNVVQQITLPCVIFFSVIALTGFPVARVIVFPLSLIVFALPVWNVLQAPLQDLAVAACAQIFFVLNIPVHITGNAITVTSGTFQVATGCSGLNLFLAATVLGILFAYLNFTARRDQIIVVMLALLLGVVCNWIRITTIILIAQVSDDIQHPIVQNHGWLGWAWFALLFAGYLYFVSRLPLTVKSDHSNASDVHKSAHQMTLQRLPVSTVLVCMLASYSSPLLSTYLINKNKTNIAPIAAPVTLLGYPTQTFDDATAWHPNYQGATNEIHLRLAAYPTPFDFHLYFYAAQSQGTELIRFDNTIADGKRWHISSLSNQDSNSENRWWKDVIVEDYSSNNIQPLLVRYWYSVAGSNTTSSTKAKLLQLKGFINKRSDAALVAISSNCATQDCTGAKLLLDKITESVSQEAKHFIENTLSK